MAPSDARKSASFSCVSTVNSRSMNRFTCAFIGTGNQAFSQGDKTFVLLNIKKFWSPFLRICFSIRRPSDPVG